MTDRFEPPVSEHTKPFWDATREHRLVLQHCRSDGLPVHYPREACPRCLGTELDWREASGHGVVYAFTVNHVSGSVPTDRPPPFVVALVDLNEGARMMTNIVGCAPADVRVGMPVDVRWEPLSDGRALPVFAPSSKGAS
jgi:uncharacterized OB-fold protein